MVRFPAVKTITCISTSAMSSRCPWTLLRRDDVFRDPRAFLRGALSHRTGTSYQLPTGAAVYFDTGVIEVATPLIELERGCMARAGRVLWESIAFIRGELDAWEDRTGRIVRLVG